MAKSNLRKLLLSSCFSAILFLSCEKEFLEEEHSNHESNIKKTKVNFDDFKENQKAFDVFKNLNLTDSKSTNKNSDVQNSNSYDFEINFNNGIHLIYHNLESYTFPIRRDVDNGLLENIVISEHTDGKYYAKLLKYNLTPQERIDLANGELKSTQNPIGTEVLGEYAFGNQIQSDCGYITITTITSCVNGHTSPSQCNLTGSAAPQIKTITVAIDCNDGSGGGGGGGTGGYNGDGTGGYYGDPFYGGGGSGGYITPDFPNDSTPTDLYEDGISEPVLDIGDGTNNYNTIIGDTENIKDLNKLTKNKSDGTKTNVKTRIDQLNTARLTSLKENGYMFDANQNTIASYNQGSNWTAWSAPNNLYYIMLHMHQDKFIPEGTTTPKPTNVAPSDTDIVGFLKLLDYTGNKNTTSIIVNRSGTFAIRVNDKGKANNAYNAIINNEVIAKDFSDKYDKFVMKPYEASPLNDNDVMNGFINFINTNLVNGQSMGLSFYQAQYDSQGNIINWVKL